MKLSVLCGREKKSPVAHGHSIYRRITKCRARAELLIIKVAHEPKRRRRRKSGDRTREVTRV
jgi:hypothetical protein